MSDDLRGAVAVVTGAARGQGAGEAAALIEHGATVILIDIDESVTRTAAALGDHAIPWSMDVADRSAWNELTEWIIREHGGIDVLVNNAGIFRRTTVLGDHADDLDAMIAVNIKGVYHGLVSVGSVMAAAGRGSIVNVASVAAQRPAEGSALYGATKAAVVALSKGASLELGPSGVRVNCVLPGGVDTGMVSDTSRAFFATIPMQRLARIGELAEAVLFLASERSSYCTGIELVVDGGWGLGTPRLWFDQARQLDRAAAEDLSAQGQ